MSAQEHREAAVYQAKQAEALASHGRIAEALEYYGWAMQNEQRALFCLDPKRAQHVKMFEEAKASLNVLREKAKELAKNKPMPKFNASIKDQEPEGNQNQAA
jgi:hypothetical protein